MQTHDTQHSSVQPKTGTPKANPLAPRPFEVTYPGQDRAASPTNPFPRRPHEVDMGETVFRSPVASPDAKAEPDSPPAEQAGYLPFSLYAPGQPPPPLPWWHRTQAKLTIGQPNDPYEQEADAVAERVMTMPEPVQRQATVEGEAEEAEEDVQPKLLGDVSPSAVQRQAEGAKTETGTRRPAFNLHAPNRPSPPAIPWWGVQAKLTIGQSLEQEAGEAEETEAETYPQRLAEADTPPVQRQAEKGNVETGTRRPSFNLHAPDRPSPPAIPWWGVQAKLTIGQPNDVYEQEADRVAEQVMSMAPPATPNVQRQVEEEAEDIQTKPLAETITPLVQRQEIPEEEPVQAKCETCEAEEPIQRAADGVPQPQPDLENRLNASQGGGSALPDGVRSFMEPRFGADFSQVRVHTGSESVQMNRDLNAQAFAHKQDIYFGSGKSPANDALTAHELTHVLQQRDHNQNKHLNTLEAPSMYKERGLLLTSRESAEINVARQPNYTKDITKLDDTALQEEALSLSSWFSDHTVDDPNYLIKLQAAVDLFIESSARSGSLATVEDIEALKSRLLARSPRTAFEQRLRRGEFPAYKPAYDEGEVVGYSRSSGGYSEVVDLEGKIIWSDEIPLETPLLDPIDLIPFEILGSLAIKAGTIGLRAIAKTGVKVLVKDVGKVGVEEGIKLGAQGATKAAAEGVSKSGIKALVQVFRKGEKLKAVGAVSLKRLRNVLGRAGANPGKYKLVKISNQVAESMEKETGEIIWGWVERTGDRVVKDAKGRPIINLTPRALSSLEEAVKTFGHEAKHLKDFAAGLTTSSEALAEKEGEKLWLVVLESLGGK